MDLLKILQASGQQDKIIQTLGKQFGMDGGKANDVVGQLMGALGGGIEKTAQTDGGLSPLMAALGNIDAEKYIDQPDEAVNATEDGNQILSQLLGSKEVSRDVASQVSANSGVDQGVIKQMLPMLATMAMGAMTKKAGGKQGLTQAAQGGGLSSIMSMLDQDNDGSPVDDIMGMLGGLTGKK